MMVLGVSVTSSANDSLLLAGLSGFGAGGGGASAAGGGGAAGAGAVCEKACETMPSASTAARLAARQGPFIVVSLKWFAAPPVLSAKNQSNQSADSTMRSARLN